MPVMTVHTWARYSWSVSVTSRGRLPKISVTRKPSTLAQAVRAIPASRGG